MDLYDTHPDQQRREIMPWAKPVLVVTAVTIGVGAGWAIHPWIVAAWKIYAAPLLDTIRCAIGT